MKLKKFRPDWSEQAPVPGTFRGTLSHHHGVGRLLAPWMEAYLGKEQMAVLRAVKRHFDPHGIMNPGGQFGLDEIPARR